jgi:aspartyl-tRNA(Asn)/glutamyl-tRNA(Gln) amidotransferase subunit A
VCGGSSSGSAAAVADGLAVFALGSDTGGSVRQPAAFCGVYGLKPTYGVLSRYGLASMASSLDCVGVLTRAVKDCGLVLDALGGRDPRDATAVESIAADAAYLRVGVIGFDGRVSEEISDAVLRAAEGLAAEGAVIERLALPHFDEALASYTVLSATEAASNLSRYDAVRFGKRSLYDDTLTSMYENSRAEGFGAEVRRRILFGVDMLSQENRERFYLCAVRMREAIRRNMTVLMERYDLLLSPTAPTVAFPIGSTPSPEQMRTSDACTVFASLAGLPALAVPFGKNARGLPLSVQLTAPLHGERRLLKAAETLEAGGARDE